MVFLDKLVVLRVHVSFQMFSRGYRGSLFDSCLRQKRLGGGLSGNNNQNHFDELNRPPALTGSRSLHAEQPCSHRLLWAPACTRVASVTQVTIHSILRSLPRSIHPKVVSASAQAKWPSGSLGKAVKVLFRSSKPWVWKKMENASDSLGFDQVVPTLIVQESPGTLKPSE